MAENSFTLPVTSGDVVSAYDYLNKPDVHATYIQKFGYLGLDFYTFMQLMGGKKSVTNIVQQVQSQPRIHKNFQSRDVVADPGAGNSIDITLAVNNLDANNRFYPQVDDQVKFKNGVTGVIVAIDTTTPSAPVLTIEPDVLTSNIGAIGANESIIIYSRRTGDTDAKGNAIGSPKPYFTAPELSQFYTKIIRGKFSYTGLAGSTESWLQAIGDKSIPGKRFVLVGNDEEIKRQNIRMGGAMLFDKPITNPAAIRYGSEQNMYGLVPWIVGSGEGNSVSSTPGNFSVPKMDEISRILMINDGCLNNALLAGGELAQDVQNGVLNSLSQNPISTVQSAPAPVINNPYGVNMQGVFVNYGVRGFSNSNYNFQLVRLNDFQNPELYGSPGFQTPKMGIVVPLDTLAGQGAQGTKSYMTGTYMIDADGKSREMKVWQTGANSEYSTDDKDEKSVHFLAHIGCQWFAANKFIVINAF